MLIRISKKEYKYLKGQAYFLSILKREGLKGWSGYERALKHFESIVTFEEQNEKL